MEKNPERHKGLKYLGKCRIGKERECIKEAAREGKFPELMFFEPLDEKFKAMLYTISKEEFVKNRLKREDDGEMFVETIIDDFYDRLGDDFIKEETPKRKEYDKWVDKIL